MELEIRANFPIDDATKLELRNKVRDAFKARAQTDGTYRQVSRQDGEEPRQMQALVSQALLVIEDVNGTGGGVDKIFRLSVKGPTIGTHSVDEVHSDISPAIDILAPRLAGVLTRYLDRKKG